VEEVSVSVGIAFIRKRLVAACNGFVGDHSDGIVVIVDRADQVFGKVKWKGRGETKMAK